AERRQPLRGRTCRPTFQRFATKASGLPRQAPICGDDSVAVVDELGVGLRDTGLPSAEATASFSPDRSPRRRRRTRTRRSRARRSLSITRGLEPVWLAEVLVDSSRTLCKGTPLSQALSRARAAPLAA